MGDFKDGMSVLMLVILGMADFKDGMVILRIAYRTKCLKKRKKF